MNDKSQAVLFDKVWELLKDSEAGNIPTFDKVVKELNDTFRTICDNNYEENQLICKSEMIKLWLNFVLDQLPNHRKLVDVMIEVYGYYWYY